MCKRSEKEDCENSATLKVRLVFFHFFRFSFSLICSANQWTGFYMISASVMKGLRSMLRASLWSEEHFMESLVSNFKVNINQEKY